ncbi:recombinase family protein [Guptibacillus hwajinpoensis]|uniref:recombinase family protein n=1 Tax=Guptibacillus hwajinpoensis TaxID=208199 RepID=UPI0024B39EB5|nr:recombinase family protein [Pseudalkalibacillus hwajinpoensis]
MSKSNNEGKECIILIRRSIEDKTKNLSMEYQEQMCLNKAKEEGYKVTEVLREEISAYNTPIESRPALQKLINIVKNGETDAVICWKKTRLVRNMTEEVILSKIILEDSNCLVIFADPTELPMERTDINRLMHMIQGWQNEIEVTNLRSMIKQHLRERAKSGRYVGGNYTGYRWNKDTKKMEFVPGEIETVKKIFNWYLYDGHSASKISKMLNEQNFSTKKGKQFFPYSVCYILSNKIYAGYYRWGFTTSKRRAKAIEAEGVDLKVNWVQPIISLEEWKKVQEIMVDRSGKKRGQKRDYSRVSSSFFLLSGKVVCGVCGKVMASHNGSRNFIDKQGTKKTSEYLRYICRNRDVEHNSPKSINSKTIDNQIKDETLSFIENADTQSILRQAETQMAEYTKSINLELTSIERKINKIKVEMAHIKTNMVQTSHSELVEVYEEEYLVKKSELNTFQTRQKTLKSNIDEVVITEKDVYDYIDFLKSVTSNDTYPREKIIRMFDTLIEKVIISGDNVEVILKWTLRSNDVPVDLFSGLKFTYQL